MIVCPKCGKELADGTKFCSKCGTALASVAAPEAPKEEAPKAEAPKAETPKAEAPKVEEPKTEAPKEEAPKAEAPKAEAPKEEAPKAEEVKTDAPKDGADGGEKKDSKKWLKYVGICAAVLVLLFLVTSLFSGGKGKHYALYLKDKEIMYSDLKSKSPKQVTAKLSKEGNLDNEDLLGESDIYECVLAKDGKTIFFPDKKERSDDGTTLYFRNLAKLKKDPVKVDSSIRTYYVNDAATLVTYVKTSNDLYQYNVKKEEKEKIASEISDFRVSEDGSKVVYRKSSGELYLWNKKDSEKLDGDIQRINAVYDKMVYYTKDGTLYKKQFTKDKEKIASDIASVIKIYESGEVYYAKNDGSKILYYYDGKESAKVAENYAGYFAVASKSAVLAYYAKESENSSKATAYVAVKKNVNELEQTDSQNAAFTEDGKVLYLIADLTKSGDEGDLYRIAISGNKIGKAEKYDGDVSTSSLTINENKQVVYFKDVKKGSGELYCDKKKIDTDVYVYGVDYCKETKQFLYLTDYANGKLVGTLKISKGGKAKKIADDATMPVLLPNGYVLYLSDYSTKYYKGDLYLYKGGKPVKLDEEVSVILSVN